MSRILWNTWKMAIKNVRWMIRECRACMLSGPCKCDRSNRARTRKSRPDRLDIPEAGLNTARVRGVWDVQRCQKSCTSKQNCPIRQGKWNASDVEDIAASRNSKQAQSRGNTMDIEGYGKLRDSSSEKNFGREGTTSNADRKSRRPGLASTAGDQASRRFSTSLSVIHTEGDNTRT